MENLVVIEGYSSCKYNPLDGPAIWTAIIIDKKVKEWRIYSDNPENRHLLKID